MERKTIKKYTHYSKEDVERARNNGITRRTLYSRIVMGGWDKEKAITTPVMTNGLPENIKNNLIKNNISYGTYRKRIRAGMSPVEASSLRLDHRQKCHECGEYKQRADVGSFLCFDCFDKLKQKYSKKVR